MSIFESFLVFIFILIGITYCISTVCFALLYYICFIFLYLCIRYCILYLNFFFACFIFLYLCIVQSNLLVVTNKIIIYLFIIYHLRFLIRTMYHILRNMILPNNLSQIHRQTQISPEILILSTFRMMIILKSKFKLTISNNS